MAEKHRKLWQTYCLIADIVPMILFTILTIIVCIKIYRQLVHKYIDWMRLIAWVMYCVKYVVDFSFLIFLMIGREKYFEELLVLFLLSWVLQILFLTINVLHFLLMLIISKSLLKLFDGQEICQIKNRIKWFEIIIIIWYSILALVMIASLLCLNILSNIYDWLRLSDNDEIVDNFQSPFNQEIWGNIITTTRAFCYFNAIFMALMGFSHLVLFNILRLHMRRRLHFFQNKYKLRLRIQFILSIFYYFPLVWYSFYRIAKIKEGWLFVSEKSNEKWYETFLFSSLQAVISSLFDVLGWSMICQIKFKKYVWYLMYGHGCLHKSEDISYFITRSCLSKNVGTDSSDDGSDSSDDGSDSSDDQSGPNLNQTSESSKKHKRMLKHDKRIKNEFGIGSND